MHVNEDEDIIVTEKDKCSNCCRCYYCCNLQYLMYKLTEQHGVGYDITVNYCKDFIKHGGK